MFSVFGLFVMDFFRCARFPLCDSFFYNVAKNSLKLDAKYFLSEQGQMCTYTEYIFVKNHVMLVANKWNDDNNQGTRERECEIRAFLLSMYSESAQHIAYGLNSVPIKEHLRYANDKLLIVLVFLSLLCHTEAFAIV